MSSTRPPRRGVPWQRRPGWLLIALAAVSAACYATIAALSHRFDYDADPLQRPIVTVLVLFAATLVCYLAAIWVVRRAHANDRLMGTIVVAAVLFRVVLLFSTPILEIDVYRYLWDGSVSRQGVSPFRYSPQQVKTASGEALPPDLARLVDMRDSSPALATILDRVHFAELPTIYPPASQAVFAFSDLTTPRGASVAARLTIMKSWLVALDLATFVLVVKLLRLAGRPASWSVIYAWCPLLMKEVANSGHLDAIAVFLATLAIWLAARVLFRAREEAKANVRAMRAGRSLVWISVSAIVLGLAVGAKLYPIVLAPWLLIAVARRINWRAALAPAIALAVTVILVLFPMFPKSSHSTSGPPTTHIASGEIPPLPTLEVDARPVDPSLGLRTFFRQWEMNDFFFLLAIENVRPTADMNSKNIAWFTVTPPTWRERLTASVAQAFDIPSAKAPFLIARTLTGSIFLALAVCFAWRAGKMERVEDWLHAGFLTLAWFWLLLPTQNPWYWTWALPLLAFARSRVWLVLGGLTFLYYLRFWLSYHWPATPLPLTRYPGLQFFDFIVTWIEFAPWLTWLAVDYAMVICRTNRQSPKTDIEGIGNLATE